MSGPTPLGARERRTSRELGQSDLQAAISVACAGFLLGVLFALAAVVVGGRLAPGEFPSGTVDVDLGAGDRSWSTVANPPPCIQNPSGWWQAELHDPSGFLNATIGNTREACEENVRRHREEFSAWREAHPLNPSTTTYTGPSIREEEPAQREAHPSVESR